MNALSWMNGTPRKILLATDLSPRCDRALDRAVALAEQWKAALVILYVLEEPEPDLLDAGEPPPSWRRPPDPLAAARRRLFADVGAVAEKADILIGQGDVVKAIMRAAETKGCDLIVTGVARDELLGRFGLGRTVNRLLRSSQVPLLVVRNRAREPYQRIVVATDLSETSRHALEAAAHIFPDRKLTVFNAYDPPMAGLMPDMESYRRDHRKVVEPEMEAFLQGTRKPSGWQAPQVLIEYGEPAALLRDYVNERNIDLVVLGSHGRSAIFEIFLGSVAKQIANDVSCDMLVIREPLALVEN